MLLVFLCIFESTWAIYKSPDRKADSQGVKSLLL